MKTFYELTNRYEIPTDGKADNYIAELLRVANNIYYEYENNGNCNIDFNDMDEKWTYHFNIMDFFLGYSFKNIVENINDENEQEEYNRMIKNICEKIK